MGKADLHAHTCHDDWCDGNQTIERLFHFVEEETDLDVFGISDHDNADTARAAWEIYRAGKYRFGFLPGIEVTNLAGHLLCYFPSGEIVDIPSLRPFWWTVRYAHEHGAICIPAHPVYPPWLIRTIDRGLARGERIDAVEAINTGIPEKAQARLERDVRRLANQVALVGNSDAHDISAVASACTEFPGSSVEEFLQALRERTTRPVFHSFPKIPAAARSFTAHRSRTRPAWVRNLWREVRA